MNATDNIRAQLLGVNAEFRQKLAVLEDWRKTERMRIVAKLADALLEETDDVAGEESAEPETNNPAEAPPAAKTQEPAAEKKPEPASAKTVAPIVEQDPFAKPAAAEAKPAPTPANNPTATKGTASTRKALFG